MRPLRVAIVLLLTMIVSFPACAQSDKAVLPLLTEQVLTLDGVDVSVTLPQGYQIELVNTALSSPRIIHVHDNNLYIGSRSGAVYQLRPPYNEPPIIIANLNNYPHSVVVHENYLYVAQESSIRRVRWQRLGESVSYPLSEADFEHVVDLPGGGGHNSRTLKLGPDNRLYVSLGISGNCSDEFLSTSYPSNDQRGGFFVLEQSGSSDAPQFSLKPFASGLRNPVGFDWQERTNILYASNNGPDHLGYELPRESFAAITENSFHGMPWFQWQGDQLLRDPCIQTEPPLSAADVIPPVATFPARIAPMDVLFVDAADTAWSAYQNDAFVALHGSWATADGTGGGNPATRREPAIVRVVFDDSGVSTGEVEPLIAGFQLPNGARWARPMGVAFGADGALYFTSDGGVHGLFRVSGL